MNVLKVHLVLTFSLLLISLKSAADTAVSYGGDESLDACSTLARVSHLSNGADGFLAVKDSPNIKAKRVDKIFNDQSLWICEESKDGNWLGIVYDSSEKKDCGVTTAIEKRRAYKGPCKSGWVSKKYVEPMAG